jgi:PadR family transcriptional regulator, regulatory protein PadR
MPPLDNLETQLRRGVLEYCVLGLLEEREYYGHELVQRLKRADGLLTSEGTIYPLLARLRREAQVMTEWQESASGPPRRYYRLTDSGRRVLGEFRESWSRFRKAVESVIAVEGAS